MDKQNALRYRIAPLEMTPGEFRRVGRELVERIAEFLSTLPNLPVTPNESPRVIREALGTGSLPGEGAEAIPLQRGRERDVSAARLRGELSYLSGGYRGLASSCRAHRQRSRCCYTACGAEQLITRSEVSLDTKLRKYLVQMKST